MNYICKIKNNRRIYIITLLIVTVELMICLFLKSEDNKVIYI